MINLVQAMTAIIQFDIGFSKNGSWKTNPTFPIELILLSPLVSIFQYYFSCFSAIPALQISTLMLILNTM